MRGPMDRSERSLILLRHNSLQHMAETVKTLRSRQ